MSSISGLRAYSPMPQAQASTRPAAADPLQKPDAPQADRLQRAGPAKGSSEVARAQEDKPLAKDKELKAADARAEPPRQTAPEPFSSTSRMLQQRGDNGDPGAQKAAEDKVPGRGTATANEVLQEKMLRQVVKMKEAYSHIQARTGDAKAGDAMNVVV